MRTVERVPRPPSVSLAEAHPDIASELDEEKTGCTAHQLTSKTSKRVWWRCARDHSWEATVQQRTTLGQGCPFCNGHRSIPGETSLAAVCSDTLMTEWDAERNTVDPDTILPGHTGKTHWTCPKGTDHRWEATPKSRYRAGHGCPYCSGNLPSAGYNLLVVHPEIAAEYDLERNELPPEQVLPKSKKVAHWNCPQGHQYDMPVARRTSAGQGCPYCGGARVAPEKSFAARWPHLVSEIHPTKNGDVNPWLLPADSPVCVLWWQCKTVASHEWEASTQHRGSRGFGCPYCSGERLTDATRLSVQAPEIAAQLDEERSGVTADQLHVHSGRKVWWWCQVSDEHRWRTSVGNRTATRGRGCPFCSGKRAWSGHNLAERFPHVARELDPALNGGLLATQLTPHSGKRVTWRCHFNPAHVWTTKVADRTCFGRGCPECTKGRRTSIREIALRGIVRLVWPDADEGVVLELGRLQNVDVLVPSRNLIIEYDGAHYHKGREERDQRKVDLATDLGYTVVRVRETPLPHVGPNDVSVSYRDKITKLAYIVFTRLQRLYPDLVVPSDEAVEVAASEAEVEYRRLQAMAQHRKAASTRAATGTSA